MSGTDVRPAAGYQQQASRTEDDHVDGMHPRLERPGVVSPVDDSAGPQRQPANELQERGGKDDDLGAAEGRSHGKSLCSARVVMEERTANESRGSLAALDDLERLEEVLGDDNVGAPGDGDTGRYLPNERGVAK